jgi:hypothetical protein
MSIQKGAKIQTNGTDNLFSNIIAENFPNLKKGRDTQVQETYRILNHQDPKRNTRRHSLIKTLNIKNKGRILQAVKEKRLVTYKGKPIRKTSDFST